MNTKLLVILGFFMSQALNAASLIVMPDDLESMGIEIDISVDGTMKRFHLDTGSKITKVVSDEQTSSYPCESKLTPSGAAAAELDKNMILKPGPYDSGQIFVDCLFDEIKRSCHLDTGATSTFLQEDEDSRSFEKVGIKKFKTAADSELTCDEIRLNKVESLGVVLIDHLIVRCPPAMKNTVGVDFFKGGGAFLFDFKKLRIEPVQAVDQKLDTHSFSILEKGVWTVPALLNGTKLDAVWDTGAGLTSVSKRFVTTNPDGFKFVQALSGSGDTLGNSIQMDLYVASHVRIGGAELKNVSVLVFDFAPIKQKMGLDVDLILGYNAITVKNWYFDFTSRRFSVE